MVLGDDKIARRPNGEKTDLLPKLEEKVESNSNKILYLIRKLNQISRVQNEPSAFALTQQKLIRIAEKLRTVGLVIEYTDGRGCLKLKPIDQKGIETLKKLNTIFPIQVVESFLENLT